MRLYGGKKTEVMSTQELREAGQDAVSRLGALSGYGIPTDAHNAIVGLAYLLDEALRRLEGYKSTGLVFWGAIVTTLLAAAFFVGMRAGWNDGYNYCVKSADEFHAKLAEENGWNCAGMIEEYRYTYTDGHAVCWEIVPCDEFWQDPGRFPAEQPVGSVSAADGAVKPPPCDHTECCECDPTDDQQPGP